MPSVEKQDKSKLSGVVDSLISDRRKARGENPHNPDFLNILEFIDRFELLPEGLYAVQKFILKLYYGIPLSDVIPDAEGDRIKIQDRYGKFKGYLSETQYLIHLHENGRCNLSKQEGRVRRELILILGRRSGKSTLSSIITVYELYKLLRRGCPQEYFGIPNGSEIRIICVANDKEQAEIVYQFISGYTTTLDYFSDSLVHDTKTYQNFQTATDVEKFGKGDLKNGGRGTITVTFKSSVAKGLRGRGNLVVILDEIAFFVDEGKSSAKEIYRAITPATAQFSPKDPNDKRVPIGPTEGKVILISSPDAKQGFFYRQYQMALAGGKAASDILMIQAPTWEVNPTLDANYYETEYAKDPSAFDTEHGAQFSDRVRGWIENDKDLTDCIVSGLKPLPRGNPREPFFGGLDFGIAVDGTSISLTHLVDGKIQLGYHEIWYPGKKWEEANPHLPGPLVPYARTLETVDRLDIDEIISWLQILSKRFYIEKGVLDQYAGHIFEQKLHKVGLTQFEMRKFSTSDSSNLYSNVKMLMFTQQLGIYDYPVPESSSTAGSEGSVHSPHITEILELQASSGGKNIVIVEAPDIPGKHDDFSDSFVRSCMLATEYVREHPESLDLSFRGVVVPNLNGRSVGYSQFHSTRARLHGPPPRERQIPGRRR